MLDSSKLRREIMRLYDRDPQGWNILVGKDRAGFYDALITHGSKAWQLKEYQVNPYRFVGLGSRIPNSGPFPTKEFPFGLRPVGVDQMNELATLIDDPKAMSELAARLLSEKPVSSREAMESAAILQGPILHSSRPLDALSSAHSRLDDRLRRELRRIVNREFRHTITPYL